MGFFDAIGKMKDKFVSTIGKVKSSISETIGKVKAYTANLRATKTSDKLTKQLSIYGDIPIVEMQYSRKPIQKAISTGLNILTLGALNETKNRLGYSDIYHDSILIKLKTGDVFRLEKNAFIELSPASKEDNELIYDVPINNREITINILLNTAKQGNIRFYEYDHTKNNCQWFANDIVVKNNLSSPELERNIKKQDAEALTSIIPEDLNNIMSIATDIGSYTQDIQNALKQ